MLLFFVFHNRWTQSDVNHTFSFSYDFQGNTCWLNAAIQGLKWCGFLDSLPSTDPSSFSTILKKLGSDLDSSDVVVPQDLLKEFQSDPEYEPRRSNCAFHALWFIFNRVDQEFKVSRSLPMLFPGYNFPFPFQIASFYSKLISIFRNSDPTIH